MGDAARPDLLYLHSDQHIPFVLACAGYPGRLGPLGAPAGQCRWQLLPEMDYLD